MSNGVAIKTTPTQNPAHHLAWMLHYGVKPPTYLRHIDGDTLNNRIENLKLIG